MKVEILLVNFSRKNSSLFKEYLPKDLYTVKSIEYHDKLLLLDYKSNLIFIDYTLSHENIIDLKVLFGDGNEDFLRSTAIFLYGEIEHIDKKYLHYFDDIIEPTHDAHLIRAKIFSMIKYYLDIRDLRLYHGFDKMNYALINETKDCRVIFISDEMEIPYEIADHIRDKVLSIEYALFGKYYESFLKDYPYNFNLIMINGVDNVHQLISFYSQIKSHANLKNSHILYINKPTDLIFLADIINLGIHNYVNHPFEKKELLFHITTQLRNQKYISVLRETVGTDANSSWYDELTGLYNKKYLNYFLEKLKSSSNSSHKISMIMVDIDKFKDINDTCGHGVGDETLKEVSTILKNEAKNDVVLRFGGDEFLIIIVNKGIAVDNEDAQKRKIDKIINNIDLSVKRKLFTSRNIEISLSLGYAISDNNQSLMEMLNNADQEMYRKKFAKK
jgi:diguanylate cyclase (GGDEF)-like protein